MANEKEPPYFNEDNIGTFHYKLPFYETMELFIETLTGTSFELRVSPFETVISVKAKIQRLEGIPVSQQHLIWNNLELEDDYCLNDYNISEGCTLKLVLAMRGGPINTRRVAVEDPIREMAEYMDAGRDEVWEKAPTNKQVTFLVYREGDQLNFFRVVDRGDGTLTPLSESLSGGSVYNLCDEDEADVSPSGQQIIENSITMSKMKLLKIKMENMNLSKKPKKGKLKPRPPVAPRPSGNVTVAGRHRLLRVLPHIGQTCPPAPGASLQSSQKALSTLTTVTSATRTMASISNDYLNKDENWESPILSPSSIGLPPKISRMEIESSSIHKNSILPPVAHHLKQAGDSKGNQPISRIEDDFGFHIDLPKSELYATDENTVQVADSYSLFTGISPSGPHGDLYGVRNVNADRELTNGDNTSPVLEQRFTPVPKSLSSESVDTSLLNTHEFNPPRNKLLSPLHYSAQMARGSVIKTPRQPKCLDIGSIRQAASQTMLRSLEVRNIGDTSFSRTSKFRGVKVDSPGKRPDIISKTEARDITEMANKASKEPICTVNNLELFASLARSASRDSLHNSCGTSRLRTSTVALPSNLQHFQEESSRQPSSPTRTIDFSSHGLAMNGNNASTGKRVDSTTIHKSHEAEPFKMCNICLPFS
ncbi:AN1-type zinc finger protein 4 isoform X2 [Ambystoma mexicanum]|uniref:AN1-type zinc finger protein 4 isoform X2 n=1 Tax=Ambystoma mexicanum TaxID=8296 RepID=UPI0037E85DFC